LELFFLPDLEEVKVSANDMANIILDALENSPELESAQLLDLLNAIITNNHEDFTASIVNKLKSRRDVLDKLRSDGSDNELRCSRTTLIYRIDSTFGREGNQLGYLLEVYPTLEIDLKNELLRTLRMEHFSDAEKFELLLLLFSDVNNRNVMWYNNALSIVSQFVIIAESKEPILHIFPELLEFLENALSGSEDFETMAQILM
jgi:hypothetical protein